jgi:guanylate kinase
MTATEISRRGLMMVLSSPSGAGKSTLSKMLLKRDGNIMMSVSATTRPPRPGEVEGQDYYFVDTAKFNHMVENDELLEHARVFDNHYGTPARPVEEALARGQDILFDIDWQGTQALAQKSAHDLVRVFILPPSMPELERRLMTRAQDPAEVVARRMAKAAGEISHWAEYDYVIVNHDLDESLAKIQSILEAERLKRDRQTGLVSFVRTLLQE